MSKGKDSKKIKVPRVKHRKELNPAPVSPITPGNRADAALSSLINKSSSREK